MTGPQPLDDPAQPKPLRVIAAASSLVTLLIGALPTFGVPLTADQTGWLVGITGALAALAVAQLGEHEVTPVSSPRDDNGRRLVPEQPPETQP